MAMIKDHDYVTVTSWECPYCHKYNFGSTTIGRYPHRKTLMCQTCAMQYHPAHALNVKYEGNDLQPSDSDTITEVSNAPK